MSNWDANVYVYALQPILNISFNSWSMTRLNSTKIRSSEKMADQFIDSCGRLWILIYEFSIRIFDQSATVLLANLTI